MMRWHCPIRLACFGWRTSKTILFQGSSANHSGCKPATPPLQRRGRFPCGRLSGLRALAAAGSRRVSLSPVRSSTSLDDRHQTLWAVSEFTAVVLRILKLLVLPAHGRETTRSRPADGQSPTLAVHPSRVSLFRPLQNCSSKPARGSNHASRPRDTRALTARNSSKTKK
jgi:hypothetical protein